jgi:Putative zinc-finger
MDHSDVVRLQAVEKYVLGELPGDLRDEFEEHYFDCSQCAQDVQSMTAFVAASRAIFEETSQARPVTPAHVEQPAARGWFAWLRPAIAVPAMAALAAVLIFQNFVTIPALKQHGGAPSAAEAYTSSYRLQGATRGPDVSKIAVAPRESFALDFDFTPTVPYQSYKGSLVAGSGKSILSFRIDGEMANKEMHVVVPGGRVEPGNYELVLNGEAIGTSQEASSREVQRIPFVIEYRR